MKLLQELIVEEVEFIKESNDNGGFNHYIVGPMLMGERPNKNNRIYPERVLDEETRRFIEEYVTPRRALGELGHPSTPTVNLDRAAILVTELKKHGANYDGRAKVMAETPMGMITKALLEEKVQLGVSTRGTGGVVEGKNGISVVQPNFRLAAVDVVHDPSAHVAVMKHIMENTEWVMVNGEWVQETVNTIQKAVHKDITQINEENALKWFEVFVRSLNGEPCSLDEHWGGMFKKPSDFVPGQNVRSERHGNGRVSYAAPGNGISVFVDHLQFNHRTGKPETYQVQYCKGDRRQVGPDHLDDLRHV